MERAFIQIEGGRKRGMPGASHGMRMVAGFTILEVILAAGMSLAAGLTLVYMAGTLRHWSKERSDTNAAEMRIAAVECELRAAITSGRSEWIVESLEGGRIWTWVGDRTSGSVSTLAGGKVPPDEQYYLIELRESTDGSPVSMDAMAWTIRVRVFWPYRTASSIGGWIEHPAANRSEAGGEIVVRR